MKGDFSRSTFRATKRYASVRMQQGRVQMDADWNEAMDIIAHRANTGTRDIIGQCGAPRDQAAFGLLLVDSQIPNGVEASLSRKPSELVTRGDFLLSPGRFYLDGIMVENERYTTYLEQPDCVGLSPLDDAKDYLIYLDVWHQHLTALEDPAIREIALGGPDTATRTRTVWQVRALPVKETNSDYPSEWNDLIMAERGKLSARAQSTPPTTQDPCLAPAGAGYRRLENQLYRVEIHKTGLPGNNGATFKWSRDNGSIAAYARKVTGQPKRIQAETPGRDPALLFEPGQWVELTAWEHELRAEPIPGFLSRIDRVDGNEITLEENVPADLPGTAEGFRIRRWDSAGALPVTIPSGDGFLPLEGGVEVRFQAGKTYRTGDYWLIPARTVAPYVEWPLTGKTPVAMEPHGVQHHYCQLAFIRRIDGKTPTIRLIRDCRILFPPLAQKAMHIRNILDGERRPLGFNSTVELAILAEGLRIECDRNVAEETVREHPTCFVELEIPYLAEFLLMNQALAGVEQVPILGYRRMRLHGEVEVDGEMIVWRLDKHPFVTQYLEGLLYLMQRYEWGDRLRAYLTLKGSYIWADGDLRTYLDGEVFRDHAAVRRNWHVPTGDLRQGGDFHLWFWLVLKRG